MAIRSKSSQKTSWQKPIKMVPLDFAIDSIKIINKLPELNAEPLYDLTRENISKLQELIDVPFISFDGIEKYPTLEEKAAVVFCVTIRGHKFGNGNKRTAVMLLLAILYVNEKWITVSWTELYKLAMKIAKDTRMNFDVQVEEVVEALSKFIVPIEA